jgi:hypothetical protein
MLFTDKGQGMITSALDGSVRAWKVTGEQQRVVESRERVLNLSGDGQRAVSTAADGTLRVWETADGKELQKIKPADGPITLALFTRDGKLMGARNADPTLKTWDLKTGEEVSRLQIAGGVRVFGVIGEGKTLAVACSDGLLRFYDLASGKLLRQSPEGAGTVMTFRTMWDGKLIMTRSTDGKVRLWEGASAKKVTELTVGGTSLLSATLLPDGRTLAIGQPGGVKLWDLATDKERGQIKGHDGDVVRLTTSADGKLLATGSTDTTILLWELDKLPPAPALAAEPTARDLDALWDDLGSDDPARGYKALWKLLASPKQTLAYLDGKLQPVGEPDAKKLAKLIDDVGSDDAAARKAATAELEQFGSLATPALKKALETATDVDVQLRLRVLLAKQDPATPSSERLRLGRTMQALELIGGVEGKKVLDKLAGGAEAAELTMEAKAAAARLARRLGEK